MEDLTKEFLAESREGLERMELCLTELEQRRGDGELVSEIFRVVHTIKGATGFLGFDRLQTLAHAGEGLLAALRDRRIEVTEELISVLLELRDGLVAILEIIEVRGSEGERSDDDDRDLIAWMAELAAGRAVRTQLRQETRRAEEYRKRPVTAGCGDIDRALRVDVDVLNRMMNLVGDLVVTRNQLLQCQPGEACFAELLRRLNGVTTELRESVTQARLQPVGQVFAKFPRMVRDLSQHCGRRVRIEFEGQETALDKSLLEAIRDPLTHAVRNAVDHGIEPEAERLRAGKPAEGTVMLRAYQKNGTVVIEVIDDGAGIPIERVLNKAVERGLITAEAAAGMTEREALQLIFAPGFSTAAEVTSVSGRGVGMDVVRTNVEQAGGKVEIESHLGAGTTLRLRVPLTMAIVPALMVECGGESYALPQRSLAELVHVPAEDAEGVVEKIGAAELYRLRGGLLPLVRLERVLGRCGHADVQGEQRDLYIAVLEPEGQRFGLVVEGLAPPEEIVVKPLSGPLRGIGVYAGATVLGNGTLAMVLDASAIGALAGIQARDEQNVAAAPEERLEERSITPLPQEDSMVVCEVTRRGEDAAVRMAIPLREVERIVTVPIREVEYAGGRSLLQYGTEVLPLEDEGDLLVGLRSIKGSSATVLICAGEKRRSGLVVQRVLDVLPGEYLAQDASVCRDQLVRIDDRILAMRGGTLEQMDIPEGVR
ncbi:MAG TPA: chemotaxis protein CheA [Acidobacteriaceae bacterium]|nr:chemotaxis protein CheA [Acidobacteriaceae bacterium]